MKKIILINLTIILLISCQATKIENREYKISSSTVELGSIGTARSFQNLSNDFSTNSFPIIKNKIRLDIKILPFNKKINNIYISKIESSQAEKKINYVDSLPNKPKFITISILDKKSFTDELNGIYNKNITSYMKNAGNVSVITDIAIVLSDENIAKIQDADAYYLINNEDAKYNIVLYKQGKKIDFIDLTTGTILAYKLGKFCWTINNKQQWYIGDIIDDNKSCKGNTYKKVKKKKEKNLFKM